MIIVHLVNVESQEKKKKICNVPMIIRGHYQVRIYLPIIYDEMCIFGKGMVCLKEE